MSATRGREAYFAAAYELLADSGSSGVTIAAMCERVGTTKGSFYHHFGDMESLVVAFVEHWQSWMQQRFADHLAIADPRQRWELVCNQSAETVSGPHPALLAWASTHPEVARVVDAVYAAGHPI